jgi:transaldolase
VNQADSETTLRAMSRTTPTALWNDSCAIAELSASVEQNGAVGATCNPVIVLEVLKKDWCQWRDRLSELVSQLPRATEDEIAWRLVEEMSVKAAALLLPIFEREHGRNGRLSIQTDPRLYRDPAAIVAQAERFSRLAPNMIVKIPVTQAGVQAIEEATYRGISINATVSFTLPQAIAVAEAVERGLTRREREGLDIGTLGSVCTLMVGRLDDWLKVAADKADIIVDPAIFEWAGVAVMKKAYHLYQERGYRLRLLSAAFRNHMHWSEFIGGDIVISPPFRWQQRYNASDVSVESRINRPVPPQFVAELYDKFPAFRQAYDEDGLTVAEFDAYPATVRTLRQFCKAVSDLDSQVRDILLPNPDA